MQVLLPGSHLQATRAISAPERKASRKEVKHGERECRGYGLGDMEILSDFECASNPTAILLWAFFSIPHIVLVGLLVFAVFVFVCGSVFAAYDVALFLWSCYAKKKRTRSKSTPRAASPPSREGDVSSTQSSPRDAQPLKLIARRIPQLPLPPTFDTPREYQYSPSARSFFPSPTYEPAPEDLHTFMCPDSGLSTPRSCPPVSCFLSPDHHTRPTSD